jgi:hypothetical protein
MSNYVHVHGAGKLLKWLANDLPAVHGKNQLIAGILGFFFGGVGLGLYFRSWKDFLYPIIVLVVIMLTMGTAIPLIGAIPGWLLGGLFAAGWGVWRAAE